MNEFLYHATWEGSLSSIKEYGLAGKDGGAIYLASTKEHAAQFLSYLPGVFRGMKNVTLNGNTFPVPQYEPQNIMVIEIPRADLNDKKLFESFDHDPEFFADGTEAFAYEEGVNIAGYKIYEMISA